eukprot:m.260052 g.260052  ORF g.260052 m.260052 type:complete len:607 (+) comp54593_c0_seq1:199-2019(+)
MFRRIRRLFSFCGGRRRTDDDEDDEDFTNVAPVTRRMYLPPAPAERPQSTNRRSADMDSLSENAAQAFTGNLVAFMLDINELEVAQGELARLIKIRELLSLKHSVDAIESEFYENFPLTVNANAILRDRGLRRQAEILARLVQCTFLLELAAMNARLQLLELSRNPDVQEERDAVRAVMHRQSIIFDALLSDKTILTMLMQQEFRRLLAGKPPSSTEQRQELAELSFRTDCQRLKISCLEMRASHFGTIEMEVSRTNIFADSRHFLESKSIADLKRRLSVKFKGEEGKDLKGLTRDWIHLLSLAMTDVAHGNFQRDSGSKYSVAITPVFGAPSPNLLRDFRFVGQILGMSLYNGWLVGAPFVNIIYKYLLGQTPDLADLQTMDEELHKNLTWVLENDVDELELCFEVTHKPEGQAPIDMDLIPNGKSVIVTNSNKSEYVERMVHFRCIKGREHQIRALRNAFNEFIPAHMIQNFTPQQLELMLCGLATVDVKDWRENTLYQNGYTAESVQIKWFWEIVESLENEHRLKLLQFATGSTRVPASGFGALEGISGPCRFAVFRYSQKNALPLGHTCFNRLDLPMYDTKEKMRECLQIAIHHHDAAFLVE